MRKQAPTDGLMFVLLSFFLVFFFTMSFFQLNSAAIPIFFAILAALIAGLTVQIKKLKGEKQTPLRRNDTIIAVSISAVVTFILNTGFLGPVIAASIVGLSYSVMAEKKRMKSLSGPVYCGAFIGMSGSFFGVFEILLAGIAAGYLCLASQRIYRKTGGTLGTIAFIAIFLIWSISQIVGG